MLKLKGKMIWYYFYEPQDTRREVKKGHRCDDILSKRAPFMGFFQTHIL